MGTLRSVVVTLVLVVSFGSLVSSCAHPTRPERGAAAISVEHPGLAAAYSPMVVVWHISWWDGDKVTTYTLPAQPAVEPVTTTLPLDRDGAEVVVVQATAHVVGGGTLAPVGAWEAPPESHLTLGPTFGRAAEAVLHVARRGLNPALINLARLHETVAEECGDQPEALDQQRLVEGLGTAEMTRYAIRRRSRPGCEVSLSVPDTDVWVSHDPTEETIEGVWADSRCYWVIPVAEGEVRHLWQWEMPTPAARENRAAPEHPAVEAGPAVSLGRSTASADRARRLTVGRGLNGHAFWFITEL